MSIKSQKYPRYGLAVRCAAVALPRPRVAWLIGAMPSFYIGNNFAKTKVRAQPQFQGHFLRRGKATAAHQTAKP